MAKDNSYKSFNDTNNQNKINGYNNIYDNNYYQNKTLIDEEDDDSITDESEEYTEELISDESNEDYQEELSENKLSEPDYDNQSIKDKYESAKPSFNNSKEKIRKISKSVQNTPENIRNRFNQTKSNIPNVPQNNPGDAINQVNKVQELISKNIKIKKENTKKKIKEIKASVKVLGFAGSVLLAFAALMIPVILLAALYEALFGLTGDKDNKKYHTSNIQYTQAEVEKSLLYVGDSRIVGMKSSLNNENIKYIAEVGKGYTWLLEKETEINKTITENKIKFVVFALGVNDLNYIDYYINFYNKYLDEDSKTHYFFLSVNPVDETKAKANSYTVVNKDIKEFNDKLQSAVGDKYIDSYSQIKGQLKTDDGIHYKNETNIRIHDIVINYIRNNVKKLGNYSLLDEYPNRTDNTELLHIPITELLGENGVKQLEESILTAVEENGYCTKQSAAAAGVTLAFNLYQNGYRIPYYWGGEHMSHHEVVNPSWGKQMGPSCSPGTCYYYYGFDCSGFTSWAYSMATNSDISGTTNVFMNFGEKISYEEAETGDILVNNDHIIMIIENKGDYLVTLESTGGNFGLIFTTQTPASIAKGTSGAGSYQIRNIQSYLDAQCKW